MKLIRFEIHSISSSIMQHPKDTDSSLTLSGFFSDEAQFTLDIHVNKQNIGFWRTSEQYLYGERPPHRKLKYGQQ